MKRQISACALASAVLLSTCIAGEIREWKSKDGRTISGELVGLYPDGAKLKLAGGKVVDVAFKLLSDEDAKHAKEAGAAMRPAWNGWPNELRMNLNEVKIRVDQDRSKGGLHYYMTEHFELKSEVELSDQVMMDVGRIFELTSRLNQVSPWGIMAKPEGGHFKAELYKTRSAYVAAGAPEWSGGVYMGDKKVFMVPVESLGLRETNNGYKRDEAFSLDTVVHEITHMLMADAIAYLPIAVTEGVAEYISHIPLRQGAFRPGSVVEMVRTAAERRAPIDFGTLLAMTSSQWAKSSTKSEQYHGALLFAYHLMHGLDGGKPERLRNLIFRAHAKGAKREELVATYQKEFAEYQAGLKEFMKLPGVKDNGKGGFSYPSNLTPPKAPEVTFSQEAPEQMQLGDMEVLYAGKAAEFVKEMTAGLQAAKINLKPK